MTLEQNLEHRNQTLRDVISILEQHIEDVGPCDHSVNICVCGIRSTLDDFGTDCYHRTGGAVGWPSLRFDIAEADANNSSFRKGTIND